MKRLTSPLLSFLLLSVLATFLPAADAALVSETQAPGNGPVTWETDPVLKDKWGVEIVSLRRTAHGHMLDFRYKVLNAQKAEALFVRKTKPNLIHQVTGKVLAVPDTAKIGPLRNSNAPKEGRTYWMFFGNPGDLVKSGDKVTVAIGDFRAEDIVVQ